MYIYIYQTELKNIPVPCPMERDNPVTSKHRTDSTVERMCRFKMQARQPAIFNVV